MAVLFLNQRVVLVLEVSCVCVFILVVVVMFLGGSEPTPSAPATVETLPPISTMKTISTVDSTFAFGSRFGHKRQPTKRFFNKKITSDLKYLQPIRIKDGLKYQPIEVYPSTVESKERFTLLMQTFNRTDLLIKLLNHYSGMQFLDRIVVVWNNLDEKPPKELWNELTPHPVKVVFVQQKINLMRNRLLAFPEIETEAVLIMDDDIMASGQDVQFAFRVWKQHRNYIVGWYPRKHVKSDDGIFTYGSFELDSRTILGSYAYSMVLIGASFVHRAYLEMFNSAAVPKVVHDLIDKHQNCDDLAFNVMVADYLAKVDRPQCCGIYVKGRDIRNLEKETSSSYRGMWYDPKHFLVRSHCLNKLAEIYSGLPLQYCDMVAVPFPYPVAPLFTKSNVV